MKKTYKGFTLVELLIVVAVIGVLATMMTMSSSDAVDSAGANTILSNLNSMKTAAYQMYMENPTIASKTNDKVELGNEDVKKSLVKYLGKLVDTETIGINITTDEDEETTTSGKYDLVGTGKSWYVVYRLDETDSGGGRAKLKAKASDVELYGAEKVNNTAANCGFVDLYTATESDADFYVALLVFGEE